MKIRMIQQMSGPRPDGRDWPAFGAEIEVPDDEGRDLCAGGMALPVVEERKAETAHVPDPRVELRDEQAPFRPPAEVPDAPAIEVPEPPDEVPVKRGPGRPPGSTNRPK